VIFLLTIKPSQGLQIDNNNIIIIIIIIIVIVVVVVVIISLKAVDNTQPWQYMKLYMNVFKTRL